MGIFFMELISVGNEDTKYLINRFVLQGLGDFTWRIVWLWRISGSYSQEMMNT